jgi:hypothetical protein
MSSADPDIEGSDDQSLADEREEEFDETVQELDQMWDAAVAGAGGMPRRRAIGIDPDKYEVLEQRETEDDDFLAEQLRLRPADRVSIFDILGEPMGYGLKDGIAEDGKTRVLVPSSAMDVVGTAKTTQGERIEAPLFLPIPRDGSTVTSQ